MNVGKIFASKPALLTIGFALFFHISYSQPGKPVSCLGNGGYCVYERGVNIIQVFGPPYSSPTLFSATLLSPGVEVESARQQGTAIYVHTLFKNGKKIGTLTDFVCSRLDCFCRLSDMDEPVTFSLTVANTGNQVLVAGYPDYQGKFGVNSSILATALPGTFILNTRYPCPFEINHQALSSGAVGFTPKNGNDKEYIIECGKGEGMICMAGGPSYPELNTNIQEFFSHPAEDLLSQTRADWQSFTGNRLDFSKAVCDNFPDKGQLLQAVDDISVLLKTQQGRDGGVLAGHNYHLAYVRDEYGISRAFLAMGYFPQARQILNFYFERWKQSGYICNAQASGIPGIFHRHENDEVEITGYILIQAFDYFEKTQDSEFLDAIMPFLEWCWEAQKKNLVGNMLPFNGDETYIAGGMIPRKVLNDGSSEATLLFVEGGRKFLSYVRQMNYKDKQWLSRNSEILDHVAGAYRQNFVKEGRLLSNNPKRAEMCTFPEYRYGVCLYPGHGGYCGILRHYKGSLYFCKDCYGEAGNTIEPEAPEEFFLPSAYLMPVYIGSTLFSKQEKEKMLGELVKIYRETGQITLNQKDKRLLGYDYGLFLYALVEFNHPLAVKIYRKMMDLRDDAGAWCEYYENNIPSGCRYRPWESGINIEAAINYATKMK